MFLRRGHCSVIIEEKVNKSPSQILFTVRRSEIGFDLMDRS